MKMQSSKNLQKTPKPSAFVKKEPRPHGRPQKCLVALFLAGLLGTASFLSQSAAQTSSARDCTLTRDALSAPGRTEADRAKDPARKPNEVLCFFGIKEGMHVLDLFSGGGYYAEILSESVGTKGHITAHNNAAYLDFQKEQIATRYSQDRLQNVSPLHAEVNDLNLPHETYDIVLMVLAYHDIYYITDDGTWPLIDGPRLLQEIREGLKPGGVFGVIDHAAEEGAPPSVGTSLHRIDPALMRKEIEAAGFIFDGELDVLRNLEDQRSLPMYNPIVQGRTDRVIYRFRKP
jgi:predicted methyltransferase